MTLGGLVSYLSPSDLVRAPINLEYASLLGNTGPLAAPGVLVGATSIPLVEAATVAASTGARVTLFDGLQTEITTLTHAVAPNDVALPVKALAYAHAGGIEYAMDGAPTPGGNGIQGLSLSQVLLQASKRIENECRQSLLQQSRTQTKRIHITARDMAREGGFNIPTEYYPVASLDSLVFQYDGVTSDPIPIDVTQCPINQQYWKIFVSWHVLIENSVLATDDVAYASGYGSLAYGQDRGIIATIGYTSGFPFTNLPSDVQQVAIDYASVALARRQNATGADSHKVLRRSVEYKNELNRIEQEAMRLLTQSYRKQSHTR